MPKARSASSRAHSLDQVGAIDAACLQIAGGPNPPDKRHAVSDHQGRPIESVFQLIVSQRQSRSMDVRDADIALALKPDHLQKQAYGPVEIHRRDSTP